MKLVFATTLLLMPLITTTNCYTILALFAYAPQSHVKNFMPTANILASRGHEVTLISPYTDLKGHPKIKMLQSFDFKVMEEFQSKQVDDDANFTVIAQEICRKILTAESIKSHLNRGIQFDIVIINALFNECAVAIAHLLGKYTILFSAGPIPFTIPYPVPIPYSYVPNYLLPLPSTMSFIQRIRNTASYIVLNLVTTYLTPNVEEILFELVPNALHIQKSFKNIDAYIENTDPVTVVNRPTAPNVASIACAHCREAKPLPKELDKFVNSSEKQGFILFSFSHDHRLKRLPTESLLNMFTQLQQKVLWKFDDDSIQSTPNVHIAKWIPQQDLLGHPHIRLFITDGDLLNLQEAVYHGVPAIGIPLIPEHSRNLVHMIDKNLAEQIDFKNLTTVNFQQLIKKVIGNPRYAQQMKAESAIIREHHEQTIDQGANSIEHIAKHGAKHLRPTGQDMTTIQFYLIDIVIVVLTTTCIVLAAMFKIVKLILNRPKFVKFKIT